MIFDAYVSKLDMFLIYKNATFGESENPLEQYVLFQNINYDEAKSLAKLCLSHGMDLVLRPHIVLEEV